MRLPKNHTPLLCALFLQLFVLVCSCVPGLWAYAAASDGAQALPVGYVAQLEVSNYNLSQAGGRIRDPITGLPVAVPGRETLYRAEYRRSDWAGDLHAYALDASGTIYAQERWSAADALAAQHWDDGRRIATLGDGTTVAGIPFRGALLASTTVGGVNYSAAQVLNYLRGDSSNDTAHAGQFRARDTPLGDMQHSRPFFIADARNPTVFVGANDGMLHAFDASSGAERWAYVPSMLLGQLPSLAARHGYFVDGQINAGRIQGSAGMPVRALFGGLGAGGKGLYALDISNLATPADETTLAQKVLWEITADTAGHSSTLKAVGQPVAMGTDYSHLGYTHGTPLLVRVNTAQGTTPSYVDALIVGNGYDDHAAGVAHLYVIQAATGALMKDFAVGPYAGLGGANGIFNPKAIDSNHDGYVDTVYGADLNGSLWKFDLSQPWTSSTSWTAPAAPLFSNRNPDTGASQPVTASLGVAAHPRGGYMVSFGTGSSLNVNRNLDTHYVYGIWDASPGTPTITPADLLTQTLREESSGSVRLRRTSALVPNWANGGHKGWKLALPAGERVVGEGSFIEGGRFHFNSYNPAAVPSVDSASGLPVQGENWLMELNYLSGSAGNNGVAGQWIANGVQSQPLLLQLDNGSISLFNQNLDAPQPATPPRSDSTGTALVSGHAAGTVTTPPTRQEAGTAGSSASGSVTRGGATPTAPVRTGRIAWRDLLRTD